MRTLVTGGAGFVGSRAVRRRLDDGDEVWVVDDLSLGRRELLPEHPRLHLVVLDCNAPELAALVADVRPDRVWHLAANSDIRAGNADPSRDRDRTFRTTVSVLEAMRGSGCHELVFASTSAVYGDVPGLVREDHGPLRPISHYGAAKLASEAYVSAYAHLYGLRAWIFRFPNVVGPNLTHGVIHDFVARLRADPSRLDVLGDGSQTKPYLDVDDLLDAIDLALGRVAPAPLEVFNVAGEGATSVRQIAEATLDVLGVVGTPVHYGAGDRGWPGDVPRFAYDTTRIRALGWTPRHDSTAAVRRAIVAERDRCRP